MVSRAQGVSDRTFPYVGAPGWLTRVHQFCVRSLPNKFDIEWLTASDRVGLSKANAQQMMSFMQKIGWINQDGSLTERGRDLRLEGDPWRDAMRNLVNQTYPELIQQIDSAEDFNSAKVEEFFVAATDMGKSGRQQMIGVFRWFLKEAGLDDLEEKVWGKQSRRQTPRGESKDKSTPPRARSRTTTSQPASNPPADNRPTNGLSSDRMSVIASVLKINIDGTWEESRIRTVFAMLDRLLQGEPIDG